MRAILVFHGYGNGCFSRFLKPGFRHCFVCVHDVNNIWIRIDGQAGLPEIRTEAAGDVDLAAHFRALGFTVIDVAGVGRQSPHTPLMLGTCVGAAKRVLGINARFVLTPWQLYRRLV